MSAIKAGDKIYFQGNQGKVMRVTHDENEPLLEVVLTQKRVAYLKPSQLDLYPFAEQINENQQIVLDWLKNRYTGNADPFGVVACLFSQTPRFEVIVTTLKLTRDEQAQVLKIFANWAQEQEEKQ
ncbi:hypothetical protein [Enterococcus gallinarum]|uniref:hypothetical protein n=1 Tax=Enterococcus gallinarum TaxID=1353 RepID=UPI0024336501|nr:hypothetical protein [Enterococcus gallinarum]